MVRWRRGGGGLVVKDVMQFDLVDDGGVWRDAASTDNFLEGEVETELATCIHQLEAFEYAFEHGLAQHMHHRAAFAVGLLDDFAGEHVDAFEVELDALALGSFGTFAFAEHFVVEPLGGLLQIGFLGEEFGKGFFLPFGVVGGLLLILSAAFGGGKESDIGAGIFIFLLRDGLFAACEETLEGFEDYLFVEVVEIAFGCFGKAHAHSPAQGVALAVEGGTLGIALAREDAEGCRGYCKE